MGGDKFPQTKFKGFTDEDVVGAGDETSQSISISRNHAGSFDPRLKNVAVPTAWRKLSARVNKIYLLQNVGEV